jgi:hypothetical protein
MHRAIKKEQVLLPQRLVQPQPGNGRQPFLLVQVFANQDVGRVADGMQADEHDQGHGQDHQCGLTDPPQQPAGHGAGSPGAGW